MKIKKLIIALLCISFVFCLAGCGSEAKKSMDTAVNSANELLEKIKKLTI